MYVKNKRLISFYAVRILSTECEGYRHALYQQIIVYTVDLITRMHALCGIQNNTECGVHSILVRTKKSHVVTCLDPFTEY